MTKSQQRIKLDNNVILTDTRVSSAQAQPASCGYRLAITAAIKDTVFDYADIAMFAAITSSRPTRSGSRRATS